MKFLSSLLLCICLSVFTAMASRPTDKCDIYGDTVFREGEVCNLFDAEIPQGDVIAVEAGVSTKGNKGEWRLNIADSDGRQIVLEVKRADINPGDFDHTPCFKITAIADGQKLASKDVTSSINTAGGPNFLKVLLKSGHLKVSFGKRYLLPVFDLKFGTPLTGATISCDRKFTVRRRTVTTLRPKPVPVAGIDAPAKALPDSTVWSYLDMDMNYKYAVRGGNYRLLMRTVGADIELIYLSGATNRTENWQRGDLKARLKRSVDGRSFDVEWYDCELNNYYPETFAEIEGNVMTINFPLLNSKLRFLRTD